MKVSVILGHPYPKSFNHAIAEAVADRLRGMGHTVIFHDLYAEGFDAILKGEELATDSTEDRLVNQHIKEIQAAEGMSDHPPQLVGDAAGDIKRLGGQGAAQRCGICVR